MSANLLPCLLGSLSMLLYLTACDPPKPVPLAPVCYVTSAMEQITQDTPPTISLQRSFTYTNSQLTAMAERSAKQQVTYQVQYTKAQVTGVTWNDLTLGLTRDANSRINTATVAKSGVFQSVFTLTYTASGRLNTLTEDRQVIPVNTGFSGTSRTYSFSYTGDNVSTERAVFTYKDGSTLQQEAAYTTDSHPSAYVNFTEPALLTILSLANQFETMPGRLWQPNALTGYQTYTISGSNRLLAESAAFADTYDASGNLSARIQTTKVYIPAGSTSFVTKPTSHTFAYDCR